MRNKVLGIESITVMIVLILLAFVVFSVIDAGAGAYDNIVADKQTTTGARVAYSYISMKIKQNDVEDAIHLIQSEFGDTLRIDEEGGEYCTYIFFAEGALYECLTVSGDEPSVASANKITHLDGFSLSQNGKALHIECVYEHTDDEKQIVAGTVGLRS